MNRFNIHSILAPPGQLQKSIVSLVRFSGSARAKFIQNTAFRGLTVPALRCEFARNSLAIRGEPLQRPDPPDDGAFTMSDTPTTAKRDPVRALVLGLVGLAIALFAYTLVADRMTPGSSQATAQAFLIRMAPEVGGRVISVDVSDNEIVQPGAPLFSLDPRP